MCCYGCPPRLKSHDSQVSENSLQPWEENEEKEEKRTKKVALLEIFAVSCGEVTPFLQQVEAPLVPKKL